MRFAAFLFPLSLASVGLIVIGLPICEYFSRREVKAAP
jgi:hypothetical protein